MTTTTPDVLTDTRDRAQPHSDRLARAVARLRTRAGSVNPARLLLIVGGILMSLGVVLVVLGWLGAAHTTNLYEQIPYAISGGLLGLGLLFAGGFCYFAFWMTELVHSTRREGRETRAALERIESLLATAGPALAAAVSTATDAPVQPSASTTAAAPATATAFAAPFVATAKGTMFHTPE